MEYTSSTGLIFHSIVTELLIDEPGQIDLTTAENILEKL